MVTCGSLRVKHLSSEEQDELLASFSEKEDILDFTGKFISPPTRKQIYNIMVQQTLSEKKSLWKTNNKVRLLLFQNLLTLIS